LELFLSNTILPGSFRGKKVGVQIEYVVVHPGTSLVQLFVLLLLQPYKKRQGQLEEIHYFLHAGMQWIANSTQAVN
jgi:hypothetical protein